MNNDLINELKGEGIRKILGDFKDLSLEEHYDFDSVLTTPLKDPILIGSDRKDFMNKWLF